MNSERSTPESPIGFARAMRTRIGNGLLSCSTWLAVWALRIAPWIGSAAQQDDDRGITPLMIVTVGWLTILIIVAVAATIATVLV